MKSPWVKARVLEASDQSYLTAVLPLFEKARKEIVLSFYLVEPDDTAVPNHPVNRLMESLLRARKRGVEVRIHLNSSFRFRPKTEVGRSQYFERLLQAGAKITTLLPRRRLHDKLIVIDRRIVVEGSTNWSASALAFNYESATVIDSPAHARKKLERIERMTAPPVPTEREIDRPLLPLPETAKIPLSLFGKSHFSRMIQASDERSLDLYLLLLGQSRALGKEELEIDLETVGRALGLPSDWARSRIRRQIIKVLRKLARRYGLIEVEFPFGRNARVRLVKLPGEEIEVPGWILSPAFLSQKSSGQAFLALAKEVLKREGVEIDSVSAPELEKRFGVGSSTIVHARSSLPSRQDKGSLLDTPLPDGKY